MRILLIEDDATLQRVMSRALTDAGYRVDGAQTAHAGEHLWRVQAYDAILLDLNLPREDAGR